MGKEDLGLFGSLFQLKEIPRTGWRNRGIGDGESVAEHTLGVVLLTMEATSDLPPSDRLKAIEMAVAHDIPEVIMGDYTPGDISPERKRTKEDLAMEYFHAMSPNNKTLSTIRARLTEYNENDTLIAGIVHQTDKLEALIQASRYRKTYPHAAGLEDFKAHASLLRDSRLRAIGDALLADWDISRPHVTYTFLIGGPGVGKGTQCAYLSKDPAVACISLGEELRKETASESVYADFISRSFEESVPVPGELAMRILMQRVSAAASGGKTRIVLDGFPRSVQQLRAFRTEMSSDFATIYLRCPSTVLEERLHARAQSSSRVDDLGAKNRALRAQAFEKDSTALLAELRQAPFWEVSVQASLWERGS
ncbi:hypothetical protein PG984_012115 [Apiospora sp. TS-2023a]